MVYPKEDCHLKRGDTQEDSLMHVQKVFYLPNVKEETGTPVAIVNSYPTPESCARVTCRPASIYSCAAIAVLVLIHFLRKSAPALHNLASIIGAPVAVRVFFCGLGGLWDYFSQDSLNPASIMTLHAW